VSEGCFLAGLPKIKSIENNMEQMAWRPKFVYHYIQDRYIKPDFIIDISEFMAQKMESIKAFKSQFYDPNSTEPMTPIASSAFFEFLEGRARDIGRIICVEFAEGFTVERTLGVDNLYDLK
jgi:LmbE family N-acetylglucosaminyl deacetylase